jgi:hypothetical protein
MKALQNHRIFLNFMSFPTIFLKLHKNASFYLISMKLCGDILYTYN